MSKIAAVLLVPSDEHREMLLREGPCGARPPMAWGLDDEISDPFDAWGDGGLGPWCYGWRDPNDDEGGKWTGALVLWCDGEPVPAGLLRAGLRGRIGASVEVVTEPCRFGTILRLDAEGREVTDG